MSNLDQFKSDIARVFFSIPASHGYLLAGGGALLASEISDRPTEDLDFFGHSETQDMAIVSRIFELVASVQGWRTTPIRRAEEFVRLQVRGDETITIDICRDVPPLLPINLTSDGPTFAGPELGGRKLLALFSRAEARDFVDIFILANKFGRAVLTQSARELDAGFASVPLRQALDRVSIYSDADLPIDRELVPALREFFRDWAAGLSA